ncbi:hypothetical protein WFZ85_10660 [Flavobacterium sp. j3]|uniref:Uncharacterized protein n=1 Tax=Flavobacterium aureirubrum TaxID=3133147 RepID=A0ABU9N949_9FLAO
MQNTAPIEEEFNLFLFAILILGIIFICISVLIALLIAILCLFAIFGFILVGAISTSILVGINKKSFTSGFKTFVTVFSTFAFGIIGIGSFWFLNKLLHWWSETKAITIGLSLGLISGLVTGLILAFVIKKLSTLLKAKLERKSGIC